MGRSGNVQSYLEMLSGEIESVKAFMISIGTLWTCHSYIGTGVLNDLTMEITDCNSVWRACELMKLKTHDVRVLWCQDNHSLTE